VLKIFSEAKLIQIPVLETFAQFGVRAVGRVASVCLAMLLIVAWVLTGPLFRLSDLYREWINKG